MKSLTRTVALALLVLSPVLQAAASHGVTVTHFEPLQRMTIGTPDSVGNRKLEVSAPASLRFDAMGSSFDLQLQPNNMLLAAAERSGMRSDIGVYRGRLADKPDSWVRVVIADGRPSGLIWDGEQMYAIESPGDSSLGLSAPVIYRLADVLFEPGALSCGSAPVTSNGAATYQKIVGELENIVAKGPGATRELEIGMVGDFEFTNDMGGTSAADAAIIARMNIVDGIYSEQLGVQITVREIETFPNSNDPFSDTTVAGDLLDEVSDYRVSTPAQAANGLTHLYTGRNLDTSTVGIAFRGALCSNFFGTGLSEGRRGPTTDALIAAHEIGHNFGAPHDGESGSDCESEIGDFIMSPSVSGTDQFSSCSITEMQDDIAAASCITALPSVDAAITLSSQPTPALQGSNAEFVFDVDNNGSLNATNVQASFNFPSNLTVNSVSASSGSCSMGTGTASCSIGTIAGFSSRIVTVSTTPTTLGTGSLSGTVTSDVDDNMSNNQATTLVTVEQGTDLRIFGTGTTTLDLDSSVTVRPTLQNQSDLVATGVTLTATLSSGLQIDSVSWGIGTCLISAQQITCQASSFAAQSSSTLDINVTGTSTGSQNYTVTIASNEGDLDESNNSASGTVNVRTPGSGGGNEDEGGGSTGPLFLWLLILAVAFASRLGQRESD
jgi:uncharacterized repeat protein (TIGR01451 family)